MDRIVVVGGGVGGTLTANLLARKLRRRIERGEVELTVVDTTGRHVYQPGFMYIAMGGERAEKLVRPERSLLDSHVTLVVGEVARIDEANRSVELADGMRLLYDQLVLATGSRIVPEEIEHFATEAHHFYSPEAALRLRTALDAFQGGRIVIGIAGMPYKCPPAPLEVAFLIESELRGRGLREKSEMTYCSPIGRAFTIESVSEMATPILAEKGIELHTFFNVEAIDPERKVVLSLEGEELGYDLLILVPPHKGAQVVVDSGLAPGAGWLPTDRHTLQVAAAGARPTRLRERLRARRRHRPAALEGRLDGALRGADRRRADRRCGRGARAARPRRELHRPGDVLLRDRRRQGNAPPVRLRPPAEAAEAEPPLASRQDRLQQDVLAHRPEGSRVTGPRVGRRDPLTRGPGRHAGARPVSRPARLPSGA